MVPSVVGVFIIEAEGRSLPSAADGPGLTSFLTHPTSLNLPTPHPLSPSAVGWQKPCLGDSWHLWSGCRLLLEKPTAEQTVTTALRTPSFFPGDFLSLPSGLTQVLSGLFDFIFNFFQCFYSVDRENPSEEQCAVTEMRCLLPRFWTPKPPSTTPRLLLFHSHNV